MGLPPALFEASPDLASLSALLLRWGYPLIFAAMLLESAGLPLPGETVTLLGGYAAGSGQLHPLGVMGAAATGAIVGDNLGYWIGRRSGWPLILRLGGWLGQSPDQLEGLRLRFLRHAGKSVLLGRFVAVLRVVAGPLAGAVGMAYPSFLLCNILGALLWSGTMVSLAWFGGRWLPLERLMGGLLDFGLAVLVLIALLALVPWLLGRLQSRFSRPDREPTVAGHQPHP